MKTLVRLVGKNNESVAFLQDAHPSYVAMTLDQTLKSEHKGPLESLAAYYRMTTYPNQVDFYPSPTALTNNDVILDIRKNGNAWSITAERVTGKTPNGVSTEPIGDFKTGTEFIDQFNKPKFKFESKGLYIFKYNSGSNPGSERFVRVQELRKDSILCDDLAINEPRDFKLANIENPRKVS
jgi:hypothetical protein